MEELINRLSRYSPQCIADKLDANFAEAITDAITILKMADAMNGLNYILFLSERERGDTFKKAYHDEVDAKAEAITKYGGFARWVAKEVCCSDEEWDSKLWAFQELACRKLARLGVIKEEGDMFVYEFEEDGE